MIPFAICRLQRFSIPHTRNWKSTKCQKISKAIYDVLDSPKKRTKLTIETNSVCIFLREREEIFFTYVFRALLTFRTNNILTGLYGSLYRFGWLCIWLLCPSCPLWGSDRYQYQSCIVNWFVLDHRKLKQQMASPESESATSESADLNSAASLLFSSVIIQSR